MPHLILFRKRHNASRASLGLRGHFTLQGGSPRPTYHVSLKAARFQWDLKQGLGYCASCSATWAT